MPINTIPSKHHGFSLIEIMVALVIIGLIASSFSFGMATHAQHDKYKKTEKQLVEIRKELLMFLRINNYLPCPDTNRNGLENRKTNGQCSSSFGTFPFLEFQSMHRQDMFGQPFFYKTNEQTTGVNIRSSCSAASLFAQPGLTGRSHALCTSPYRQYCGANDATTLSNCNAFCSSSCTQIETRTEPPFFNRLTPPIGTQTGSGGLIICSEQANQCNSTSQTAINYVTRHVPLIVGSYGFNGAETWLNCDNARARERYNCQTNRYFQLDPYSESYDDMMIWISIQDAKTMVQHQIDWFTKIKSE